MPITVLTARDVELLTALDRCPLTAAQLVKLSQTFPLPFRADRLLRRRMSKLEHIGLVRRAMYTALAGRGGTPNYYLLTPLGHRMLHGPDARPPAKRFGHPLAPAGQYHTHALAEVIVHFVVAARRAGVEMTGFCRENTVALSDGQHTIYPDSAFQLLHPGGVRFSYFVELDNSTERLVTDKDTDSWQRKICIYESVRQSRPTRFRVLVVSTRSAERISHILSLSKMLATNPRRTLFCGTVLPTFLATEDALTQPVFCDHLGRETALISGTGAAGMSGELHEKS